MSANDVTDGIGDIEPDDVFSAEGVADPEQVARRLHEQRRWIGSGEPEWDHLPPEAREVGVVLVTALLAWLISEGSI